MHAFGIQQQLDAETFQFEEPQPFGISADIVTGNPSGSRVSFD